MGGAASKVSAAAPQAKKAAETLQNTAAWGMTMGKRRVEREGQQFMASERAQEALDAQQRVPKRAPLNLGSAKVSEETKAARLREVKHLQQEDSDYLSLMKNVYVSSKDPKGHDEIPADVHSSKRSEELEKKLPKSRSGAPNHSEVREIPRGRTELRMAIDALYNHQMNPEDWGAAKIAEKLELRETDTENILRHFKLLEGTSIFRSRQNLQRRSIE